MRLNLRFTLAVIERLDELHLGEVNAEKVDRLGACASLTGSVSKIPVVHRLDERSDQGECRSLFDGLMSFCLNAGCSGLMKPDTLLGENARQIEVSDDQTTPYLFR